MTDLMQIQQQDIEIPGEILRAYGRILKYPDKQYCEHVQDWVKSLKVYPKILNHIQPFVQHVQSKSLGKLEELFVKTFEMNKKRPLEIGWHLYGEEYKRGQFLVKMRELLREKGIQEQGELPDHLTYCLRVLPLQDPELSQLFTRKYLRPALEKIIAGFGEEENQYLCVIESVSMLLDMAYGRSKE